MSDKEWVWHWHLDQYPNFCEVLPPTERERKIEKFKENRKYDNFIRGSIICP
jgi:hypothetical protein